MGAAKGENQEMIKLKDIRKKKKDDKATMNAKIDPKEKDQEVSSDVEESVNEAEMTAAQKKKREEIVLKMKDKEDEFKKNYGDRWKEVMYATATKMAMKEEVELDEDLAADIRREKEKQARNKARTATANTEIDRNKATDKLHKMGLNRSMDRAKHYDARMKLSGLRKEAAPKIDDKKYSEYMASRQKPMRQSSTKKSLADIRKKAEKYKKEEINLSKKEEIFEAKDQSTDRLKMLVRLGLMDKKDMTKIVRSIGKMKEDKPVSPADRKILFDLLNELIGMVTGDEQMFQKAKKAVREEKDPNEYDKEGEMMKNQLRQICSANEKLMKMVGDDDNLPEWVQNKVTKATDYIRSVRDYLEAVAEAPKTESASMRNMQLNKKIKKYGVVKTGSMSGKKDATTNNWGKRRPQDRQAAVDSMLGPDHPYNSKNRNKK